MLITCDQPKFVVAIENKIGSGEHSDQLSRYRQVVESEFGDTPSMYAFLTIEGDEASEEDWVPYSYGDVHRVLHRVRTANASSIGDDVLAFLDHYLRLIRGRLMDDPKIDELCERIYKNHRRALELINERIATKSSLMWVVAETLEEGSDRLLFIKRTGSEIHVIPKSWENLLPPIGDEAGMNSRWWIRVHVQFDKPANGILYTVLAGPADPVDTRRELIRRFASLIGTSRSKKITDKWTRLRTKKWLVKWDEGDMPDEEQVRIEATRSLLPFLHELDSLEPKLREVIMKWRKEDEG